MWTTSTFFCFRFGDNDAFIVVDVFAAVARFGDADVVRFSGVLLRVGEAEIFLLGENPLGRVGELLLGPIF